MSVRLQFKLYPIRISCFDFSYCHMTKLQFYVCFNGFWRQLRQNFLIEFPLFFNSVNFFFCNFNKVIIGKTCDGIWLFFMLNVFEGIGVFGSRLELSLWCKLWGGRWYRDAGETIEGRSYCVYSQIITLSNGLMFITSTTTGIMEVYSRTKLYR